MKAYHLPAELRIDGIPSATLGLLLRTHDDPQPGPEQVLLRVRTTSLNFADLVWLSGMFPISAPYIGRV
jgi:NADPH:quinone reductase-like Zn-dependent oxidoreductase